MVAEREERAAKAAAYVDYIEKEISHESFQKMLAKFTDAFDTQVSIQVIIGSVIVMPFFQQLKEFLDKLWTDAYRRHAQLSNLCIRLDYNGFYSSQYAT